MPNPMLSLEEFMAQNPSAPPRVQTAQPAGVPTAPARNPAAAKQMTAQQILESRQQPSDARSALAALFASQQRSVDDINKLAEAEAARPADKYDLKKLAAIADLWTGGSAASNMPEARTEEAKQMQVAKLRGLANEQQATLSKQQIDLLKSQELDERGILKAILAGNRSGMEDIRAQNLLFQKEKTLEGQIQKEIEKPLQEKEEIFQNLSNAWERGDLQSVSTAISGFSRNVGTEKGVLTDNDVNRTFPATIGKTWKQVEAYFTNNPQALLDPKIVQGFKELTDIAKDRMAARFRAQLSDKKKRYASMGSYKGLMDPGGSGDVMFQTMEERLNTIAPPKEPKSATYEGKPVKQFKYNKEGTKTRIIFADGKTQDVDGIVK